VLERELVPLDLSLVESSLSGRGGLLGASFLDTLKGALSFEERA